MEEQIKAERGRIPYDGTVGIMGGVHEVEDIYNPTRIPDREPLNQDNTLEGTFYKE